LLLREYVPVTVQFLFQNIKNTCRRSRQFSYKDYLQNELLNLDGIYTMDIIKSKLSL